MFPVLMRNRFILGGLTGTAFTLLSSYVYRQYTDSRRLDSYFALLDKYPQIQEIQIADSFFLSALLLDQLKTPLYRT